MAEVIRDVWLMTGKAKRVTYFVYIISHADTNEKKKKRLFFCTLFCLFFVVISISKSTSSVIRHNTRVICPAERTRGWAAED